MHLKIDILQFKKLHYSCKLSRDFYTIIAYDGISAYEQYVMNTCILSDVKCIVVFMAA